jgi:hypothetical protein
VARRVQSEAERRLVEGGIADTEFRNAMEERKATSVSDIRRAIREDTMSCAADETLCPLPSLPNEAHPRTLPAEGVPRPNDITPCAAVSGLKTRRRTPAERSKTWPSSDP